MSRCISLIAATLISTAAYAQVSEEEDFETVVAPRSAEQALSADTSQVAALIIEQTNQFREQQGLKLVDTDSELMDASQYFADYMARTNKYGHTADGQRPAARAKEHGYQYCSVLENIAYRYSSRGFQTQKLGLRFTEGWKQSPGHRKNMLDADVTQTGVAVAWSKDSSVYYAVQMFGRPQSERIAFQVTNRSGEEVEYSIGKRTISLPPRVTISHERCRHAELVFQWGEESSPQTQTVKPRSGDQFVVERASAGLSVIREQ